MLSVLTHKVLRTVPAQRNKMAYSHCLHPIFVTIKSIILRIVIEKVPRNCYGCESWTIKKAEHRKTDGFEDSSESLGLQGDQTSQFKGNQSLIFIKRTDAETEAPIL